MGAPSGGQGAGRYINASAPTFNFNAPQNTNANLPAIPVAQNNLNFAAPTGNVRQYAPLTVPQQLKTETTREVLPMNYVNLAGRGASPAARIEKQRQAGGYDTLERQMKQRYARRSRSGGAQYLDINTLNVDPRRYMVQDYQTGWVGSKQTPTSMINNLMLASNAFTPAPIPTVLPTASAPADGLGRFLGEQATGGNIATGRPTGGK